MLQRDVNILLTVKIPGITAHAALQPVVFFIVTRQTGEAVVVRRTRRGDTGRYHRIFIGFQRLLRLAVLRLETCGITQHQRVFHGAGLRFSLRNNFIEGLFCGSGIAQARLRHRDPALHIERQRLAVLRGGQFRQLTARRHLCYPVRYKSRSGRGARLHSAAHAAGRRCTSFSPRPDRHAAAPSPPA